MEIKRQIQLISGLIVLVVVFIFVVTSFSKEFYFQAFGHRETRKSFAAFSYSVSESGRDGEEVSKKPLLKNDEESQNGTPLVFMNRGEKFDIGIREDVVGPENDEGQVMEDPDKDKEQPPLAHVTIEDGTERHFTVLMFHDVVDSPSIPDSTYLSKSTFENILRVIKEREYQTIDVQDLVDFVEGRKDLAQKSVMLTFDDGYYSNYRLVYPILKREGMKAVYFPIGVSVGKRHYKGTELEMMRHYSIEDMQEMQDSGLIEFGSHSYDMHQNVSLEAILGNPYPRVTILRMDTETEEDYISTFQRDLALNADLYKDTGLELLSFSCPRGGIDELSLSMLKEAGFRSVFISKTGINTIVKGQPETLYLLKRYNMSEDVDVETLLP